MHLHEEEVFQMGSTEEMQTFEGNRLEFDSVGIDIGSSTSHLMFSRLVLARRGREYFSGYTVIEREVVYRSPVMLTPFESGNSRIDAPRLSEFIQQSYIDSGLEAHHIDTGAVITTGEAAKKENTAAIIQLLAEDAGKFVCAAAGPSLEAVLAAHGSGAVKYSRNGEKFAGRTVLNVDIGGGTSKIAVVRDGRVVQSCAASVGSRLVAWDENGFLTRVEECVRPVAEFLNLRLEVGQRLEPGDREILARQLVELLFEIVRQKTADPLAAALMITAPLKDVGPVAAVFYSGGVAEFIYGKESRNFGDLGELLGQSILDNHRKWGVPLESPLERICATVIGASQYTVQVSGNTIYLSDSNTLPLHNVPVVKLPVLAERFEQRDVAAAVRSSFGVIGLKDGEKNVALAVNWKHEPDYCLLSNFAKGLIAALPETISGRKPLILIFDNDVANLIGRLLADLIVNPIVSIDSINVGQLSYIDIGSRLETTSAVPVTVKSLIFR